MIRLDLFAIDPLSWPERLPSKMLFNTTAVVQSIEMTNGSGDTTTLSPFSFGSVECQKISAGSANVRRKFCQRFAAVLYSTSIKRRIGTLAGERGISIYSYAI
jgi:hypothetical protein